MKFDRIQKSECYSAGTRPRLYIHCILHKPFPEL